MALAYSVTRQGVSHDGKRYFEADVTFDASYPTGGEAVDHAAIGLTVLDRIELIYVVRPDKATTGGAITHGQQILPDVSTPTAAKLLVYTAAATEAADTSDQSAVVQRVRFVGW